MTANLKEENKLEILDEVNEVLLTPEKVSSIIEARVKEVNGSYIEEAAHLFEEYDLEISENLHLLPKTLIDKIKVEAISKRMVKEVNNTNSLSNLFA